MDVSELIEEIQSHVGEDLTAEQIAAIRAKLANRRKVREALLEELWPPEHAKSRPRGRLTSFDDVMARIDALVGEGGRGHWATLAFAAAVAAALLAAVVLAVAVHRQEPPATPPAVASSRPSQAPPRPVAVSRPATAPATRPTDVGPAKRRVASPRAATTRPARADVPEAGVAMTWEEYVLPDVKKPPGWAEQVDDVFQRRSGTDATAMGSQRYVELDGTYRLGVLPGVGRMLRLGLWQGQSCDLELWSGGEGVRLEIDLRAWSILAQMLTRRDGLSPPTVGRRFDDQGAWRWYGGGAIDLRYQAGHLLICRGEMLVLRVPLARAPTEGEFTGARVRLWLAQVRKCNPLALPAGRSARPRETRTTAAKLDWDAPTGGKAKFSVGRDGAVSLSCDDVRTVVRAGFVLDVPQLTSVEVDVHVRDATVSAGVFVAVGKTYRPVCVFEQEGKRVVGWGDRRQMAEDIRAGHTVGKDFWVRFRRGLGVNLVWVSPDGRTWWPRRQQPLGEATRQLHIGLYLPREKAPRRVAVDEVRVRRFTAIRDMARAEPELVARAESAVTKDVLSATSREQAMATLAGARGGDTDGDAWRTACDVVLAVRCRHVQVRQAALRALFLTASHGRNHVEAVLAAMEELNEAGHAGAMRQEIFEALGRSCLRGGKPEALKALLDASYVRPSTAESSPSGVAQAGSPGLLRMALLDLIARKKWSSVRLEALRAMFLSHSRGRTSSALARWAVGEAQRRLAKPASGEGSGEAWHGLVVGGEGEVMNVLGEFSALVAGGHYEAACKAITSRPLPDVLVSLAGEGDLLRSSHSQVREVLAATPRIRQILRKRYSEIGMIRLGRARRRGDLSALRSLSAQFYGTPPGYGAMHVLADRDLSGGDFRGAAAGYEMLQTAEDYPGRVDAAVKFRLVSAMLGRLAGKPVTDEEALPEGTDSAAAFERMVGRLASSRRAVRVASSSGPEGPGPGAPTARLTVLAKLSGTDKTARRRYTSVPPVAMAVDAERVFVSRGGAIVAVDWRLPKVLWSVPAATDSRGHPRHSPGPDAARPVLIGQRVYVRQAVEGRPLACFDAKTGKRVWSRQYHRRIVSDPIRTGSGLSMIATAGVSGAGHLHRVSADTGESSSSCELVRLGDDPSAVGRPVVVGETMLFRTAGCLVCCDRRGAVRWARRLPFVPAAALPALHTVAAWGDMIVRPGGTVIFSAPGCPYITCVSAANGQVLWSAMIHSATRLIGVVGDSVIVAESDAIRALDAATGKIRWHRRCETEGVGILPAAGETVLVVRLRPQRSRRKDAPPEGRTVRWLSARDGQTVRELVIQGDREIHGVSVVSGDGKRLFGVSDLQSRKSDGGKIFVIELGAAE